MDGAVFSGWRARTRHVGWWSWVAAAIGWAAVTIFVIARDAMHTSKLPMTDLWMLGVAAAVLTSPFLVPPAVEWAHRRQDTHRPIGG